MGSRCVKAIGQLFVRLETSSSSRPWKYGDGARRSSQGRPAGPPRSGLALTRSSTPSGWHGRGEVLAHRPFGCRLAISGSSRFGNLGLHARSNSHSVVARGELHQDSACGGQAREDEAILRCGFARPCNPSVRPPGSAEADRASAIGFPREEA